MDQLPLYVFVRNIFATHAYEVTKLISKVPIAWVLLKSCCLNSAYILHFRGSKIVLQLDFLFFSQRHLDPQYSDSTNFSIVIRNVTRGGDWGIGLLWPILVLGWNFFKVIIWEEFSYKKFIYFQLTKVKSISSTQKKSWRHFNFPRFKNFRNKNFQCVKFFILLIKSRN